MKFINMTKMISRVLLTACFWLFAQSCLLNTIFRVTLYSAPFIYKYRYEGIRGDIVMTVFINCFAIVLILYTLIGSIILRCIPINTKRWWLIISVLYVIYMALSVFGAAWVGGSWFWDGSYSLLMAFVWIAPVLWLLEIEVVNWFWINQRKKYIENNDLPIG